MNPFNLNGVEFLTLFAALFVVAALAAWFLRWALRAPNDDPDFDLDKLKPYQVAYLQGGSHAVLSAAVASLVQEGAVDINASDGTITATGFGNRTHDGVEEIALTSVKSVSDLRKGNWETEESIVEIRGALEALNLVLTSSDQETVVIGSFAPFAVLTFFGAVKVAIGISRDKPVGILVFACIAAISAAVYLWRKRPLRTGRGDRTLALLQTQNAALKTTAASNAQDFTPNDLILATGLFGIMAVTHPALDTYRSQWRQNFGPQTSGSDGGTGWSWGSSSCSGSSCGGGSGCGGGGCGGCSSS